MRSRSLVNSGSIAAFVLAGLMLSAFPVAAQVQPAPVCLYAFSKDMCGTRLFGGTWGIPSCTTGTNCNNLVGLDATFRGGMASSAGTCGPSQTEQKPCDEAPDFTGTLEATVDVRAQRHTHCKARGSYGGKMKITDDLTGIQIAEGELVATLGMGTHRPTCFGACGTGECETCHDARIIDEQLNWEVGSEGTISGRVLAGRYAGCNFTGSYQGNFITDGDSRGPTEPFVTWGFCGSLEGVLECPCGIPAE